VDWDWMKSGRLGERGECIKGWKLWMGSKRKCMGIGNGRQWCDGSVMGKGSVITRYHQYFI